MDLNHIQKNILEFEQATNMQVDNEDMVAIFEFQELGNITFYSNKAFINQRVITTNLPTDFFENFDLSCIDHKITITRTIQISIHGYQTNIPKNPSISTESLVFDKSQLYDFINSAIDKLNDIDVS